VRGNPLPVASLIYVVLGELAYEANDLEQAQQHLQIGMELGQQSATTLLILYSLEALAQVKHAMGQTQEALATIREAQEIASQADELEWRNAGAAIEAALHLKQGDVQTAEQWAEKANLPLTEPLDRTRRHEYTIYVRLLLDRQEATKAKTLLAKLEHAAREDGRHRHLLTIHIQQALVEQMLGNKVHAQKYLEQALHLAAPGDYVRAFLDEAPALSQLLSRARHVAPEFVDELLSGFAAQESRPHPHTSILIEPLSERELEVLRLLATNLSAPEIADELVVAVSTIRSHTKHIYQKLDAHSRYEAVERARTLDLL
jgi:LuxR family maltose regulon positive regulatory protein